LADSTKQNRVKKSSKVVFEEQGYKGRRMILTGMKARLVLSNRLQMSSSNDKPTG